MQDGSLSVFTEKGIVLYFFMSIKDGLKLEENYFQHLSYFPSVMIHFSTLLVVEVKITKTA